MNQEDLNNWLKNKGYSLGFITEIQSDTFPPGLNEGVIKAISIKKNEPQWLLEWRLSAYKAWLDMIEPHWSTAKYTPIDYQQISYFSAPKKENIASLDELDPQLLETYKKLGISLDEQKMLNGIAIDAVFDSVSVATTFKEKLKKSGVIFCSFSEAVQEYPELVKKYIGKVVPPKDNFFAALNAAVFSDGTFVYIPADVKCPMDLSTYFRINERNTGQFERTLIIVEENGYVSYLEGCSAPQRDNNQLHAAVVELIAAENAEIKYSTVQNWYPGDKDGKGGVYNFVTKRGLCKGKNSKISWTQVETGSAITWKYPSVILEGDNSIGEFYSVSVVGGYQQADTGTKMIHIGKNTHSTIISKSISTGHGYNTYRGLVQVNPKATNSINKTECDSLLVGGKCGASAIPVIKNMCPTANIEHEATVSRLSEEQLLYAQQRGLTKENASYIVMNGFCKDVFKKLPMEFAVEAQSLLNITLEGAIG